MDIRNRTNDVVALRCHVCQDFLKLVLVPDWKSKLYQKAKYAVENNSHRDNYIEAYNKMRDMSLDAYSVDCMDVSFISVIVQFCGNIAPTQKSTREALRKLAEDRNTTNHANENEPTEELYLRGLLSVVDIISFIRTVDLSESTIPDNDRLAFRTKWMSKAEELKTLLDEERIELVQIQKEIDRDIKVVKDAKDSLRAWCDVHEKYIKHYRNTDRYNKFMIAASDEGITFAHSGAALSFLQKRNYDEFFSRLQRFYTSNTPLSKGDVFSVLEDLNLYLDLGNEENEQFKSIIDHLKDIGFDIYQNQGGYYKIR